MGRVAVDQQALAGCSRVGLRGAAALGHLPTRLLSHCPSSVWGTSEPEEEGRRRGQMMTGGHTGEERPERMNSESRSVQSWGLTVTEDVTVEFRQKVCVSVRGREQIICV